MKVENFTPGPWVANGNKIETIDGIIRARIAIIDDGAGIDDPDANSRLIAAAPDLYEYLKYAVECVSFGCMPGREWLENASSVLRKSRGEI